MNQPLLTIEELAEKRRRDSWTCVLFLVFFGSIIGLLCWNACHESASEIARKQEGSAQGAFFAAQEFVRRELTSPGSADWAENFYDAGTFEHDAGTTTWTVRSWVDSQNRFGASLRTHYKCTMRYTGKDWRKMSLEWE